MRSPHLQLRGAVQRGWQTAQGDALHSLCPTLPAHAVPSHRHDHAHLILVLRGAYQHDAAGARQPEGAPLLVFNPPRTEHRDCFAEGQDLQQAHFLALHVSAERWWLWQQQLDLPSQPLALSGPGLVPLARCLAQALQGGPESADDCFMQALDLVHPAPALRNTSGWLQRARLHVREQALDGQGALQLTALATALQVHPVSLSRAFQRQWRCSPLQYAQALRLDRAAALLRGPGAIAGIAAQCGFFDQAHLARQFRRAYGCSPSAYRRVRNVQAEAFKTA